MLHHNYHAKHWFNLYMVLIGGAAIVLGIVMFNKIMIWNDARRDMVHMQTEVSTIKWVTDPDQINAFFEVYEHKENEEVLGLAVPDFENGTCTIYAKLPKGSHDKDALATLGHEVLHCYAGQYHK